MDISKQQLYRPHNILLGISFGLLFFVAIAYGYMKRTLDISIADIVDKKTVSARLDALKVETKTTSDTYKETAATRADMHSHIISNDRVVDLIVTIEAIGKASGSKILIGDISQPDPKQPASSSTSFVDMTITVSGSRLSVIKTLTMLENIGYVSRVENLKLEISDKDTWSMYLHIKALTI